MSYWVVRNSNTLISFNSFDRKSINFGLRHSANLAVCRLRHWANTFWPFGNTTTEQHRGVAYRVGARGSKARPPTAVESQIIPNSHQ